MKQQNKENMKNLLRLLYCVIVWPVSWLLEWTIGYYGMTLIPKKERTRETVGWYRDSWKIVRKPWDTRNIMRGI